MQSGLDTFLNQNNFADIDEKFIVFIDIKFCFKHTILNLDILRVKPAEQLL